MDYGAREVGEVSVLRQSCSSSRGGREDGSCGSSASLVLQGCRVQELCESRGGRPGLSVLMSLMVSVDVKQH